MSKWSKTSDVPHSPQGLLWQQFLQESFGSAIFLKKGENFLVSTTLYDGVTTSRTTARGSSIFLYSSQDAI